MSQRQEQIQTIDPSFRISLSTEPRTASYTKTCMERRAVASFTLLYHRQQLTSSAAIALIARQITSRTTQANSTQHAHTNEHGATQRNPNLTLRTTHTLSLSLAIRAVNAIVLCFVDCHRLLSSAERTVEKATCADVRPQ